MNLYPTDRPLIGSRIILLNEVDSTNEYLKRELKSNPDLSEGTLVSAEFQTDGKGQMGNQWLSISGQNILFSFYLKPKSFPINKSWAISAACALGIVDFLQKKNIPARVKWPNDIVITKNKIAGILIENSIQGNFISSSIAGIGFNFAQTEFPEFGRKATSLIHFINPLPPKLEVLKEISARIEYYIFKLKNHQFDFIKNEFEKNLYLIDQKSPFLINNSPEEAEIKGISDEGLLKILLNNEIRFFDLKEISYGS